MHCWASKKLQWSQLMKPMTPWEHFHTLIEIWALDNSWLVSSSRLPMKSRCVNIVPSDLFILRLACCITFNKKHTRELYSRPANGRQLNKEPQNTQQSVRVEPQSYYKLKLKLDTVNAYYSWTAHPTLLRGDVIKTTSSLEMTVKSRG